MSGAPRPAPAPRGRQPRLPAVVITRVGERRDDVSSGDRPLPLRMLEQRLVRLCDPRIVTLPVHALLGGLPALGDRRPLCLCFDGGDIEHGELVLPLLERLGLRATFFVPPARLGRRGAMHPAQLKRLRRAGMAIGLALPPAAALRSMVGGAWRRWLENERRQFELLTGERARVAACLGPRPEADVLERLRAVGLDILCFGEPGRHWRIGGMLCLARLPLLPSTPSARWLELVRMHALSHRDLGFSLPDDRSGSGVWTRPGQGGR